MNVWKSCHTISQIIDVGFNFGLNPLSTHIGGYIIELWWFVFHFCNFWDEYFVLYINHSQVQNGWRFWKKNILVWFNPTRNQTSSKIHHGPITSYTFTQGTISFTIVFVIELFMGMTKSQVKFIIMKNVLLEILKGQNGTIGTLDDWKATFNVFDPYTIWNELHYNSNF